MKRSSSSRLDILVRRYDLIEYYISRIINIYVYILQMFLYIKKSPPKIKPLYDNIDFKDKLFQCATCIKTIGPSDTIHRGWDLSFCCEKCRNNYQH